jgi:putative signal transducing protein
MEKDWVPIYSTDKEYQAHIIKDMLKENGIDSVIFNKQDSAYVTIGNVEIYVKNDFAIKAKHLIENLKF